MHVFNDHEWHYPILNHILHFVKHEQIVNHILHFVEHE